MEGRGGGVWVGGWVDGVCVWWVGGGVLTHISVPQKLLMVSGA